MKPTLILAAIAALALGACVTTTTTSTMPAPIPAASVTAPVGSMTALMNAARAGQGRGGVVENARLSRAAQLHAQDMVAQNYFSHSGANGSSFTQRAQAAGYGCAIAENIASGQPSEAAVMEAWMQSSGHRRNILLPNAREFGIGRSGTMWVLMMGSGC